MADKRNPRDNKHNISIEEDYIELLNSVKLDDEYEDIYSDSSHYEDSSEGDIYIGKVKSDDNDIYISRRGRKHHIEIVDEEDDEDVYSYINYEDYEEDNDEEESSVCVKQPKHTRYAPQDEDEVSDFEARHGKRSKKKKHPILVFILILLVLTIGLGGAGFLAMSSVVGEFTEAEEIVHIDDVNSLVSAPHVRNILLIGADKEKGGASRSDSIMICSINSQTGKITVVSILRDTHLDVPGHRESKINAAHSWGGPNLLIQTIEQNFGIKIDDYATVNFDMFKALVDGIGGIYVDVSEAEAKHLNSHFKLGQEGKRPKLESGENVYLDGYYALCYARIRKLDSDFQRTERQQKVIAAIIENIKGRLNPAGIPELMKTAKAVAPYIETTLSEADVLSLITSLSSCLAKSGGDVGEIMVSAQLPYKDTWWYSSEWDGSSISIDLDENKQLLYNQLYGEVSSEESTEDTQE